MVAKRALWQPALDAETGVKDGTPIHFDYWEGKTDGWGTRPGIKESQRPEPEGSQSSLSFRGLKPPAPSGLLRTKVLNVVAQVEDWFCAVCS
jgi:hypothetical protein